MAWESYHISGLTEKYLYKFLSIQHLQLFLESGSIWFSRADKFGDKMECVVIDELLKNEPDYKRIEENKNKFLISCWHLADNESLSLWDTYASTPEKRRVVAIRFERKRLIKLMQEYIGSNDTFYYTRQFIHGAILYKNLVNADFNSLYNARLKYPAFRKEAAFQYEQEYRFVVKLEDVYFEEGFLYHIGRPSELSFDILINPLLNKDEYSFTKKEIAKTGFSEKIVPSALEKWLAPEKW